MPDELIRWNDFLGYVKTAMPLTVQHVADNQVVAMVRLMNSDFEIRPRPDASGDVDLWGPPFVFGVDP